MTTQNLPPSRLSLYLKKTYKTLEYLSSYGSIAVRWPEGRLTSQNWGDKLNPVLCRFLSQKKVFNRIYLFPGVARTAYVCIGSSLGNTRPNEVVWGHGFMSERVEVRDRARQFLAVRGPLSQDKLYQPASSLRMRSVIQHC